LVVHFLESFVAYDVFEMDLDFLIEVFYWPRVIIVRIVQFLKVVILINRLLVKISIIRPYSVDCPLRLKVLQ
jgi:hypothetical protein